MNQHMVREIYERHADNIYRLCYSYVKNAQDAQDALQNTFVKLMRADMEFDSVEHEKAWLIVTAGNTCKDMLKSWWYKRTVSYDENTADDIAGSEEDRELLEEILNLPVNIRVSVYLHYYEGYSSAEIGKLLKKGDGTVRGYLKRGRELLRERLGEF
ncbi:MAG: RNA polymerase sigma factor [Thermoflexaceae bacterium]|nr:RNA polymerase sigma factor [Thermoflexaceae bacterium]